MPNPARSRRMVPAILLTIAAGLATASSAVAQAPATATATPAEPGGKPTQVHWAVDGALPPVSSRFPSSVVFSASGFGLDKRAVSKRCAGNRAILDECPARSLIGTANLTVIVHGPRGRSEVPLDTKLYRGVKPKEILAVTRVIDVRVRAGTLEKRNGGVAITFSLPEPPPLPGVSYEFKTISADLGVSRKVTRRVRTNGRRKKRTVRYSLIRTPRTCDAGSWAAGATLTFPDTTIAELPSPITCSTP